MNPEIKALIEKAKRSQKAASNLFKDGDIDLLLHAHIIPFSMLPPRSCFYVGFRFQVTLE